MKLILPNGQQFEGSVDEYKALNLGNSNRPNKNGNRRDDVKSQRPKFGIRESIDAVKNANTIEAAIPAYIGIVKQCKTKEKLTVADETGKIKCTVDAFASKIREVVLMVLEKEFDITEPTGTYVEKANIINEIEMLFGNTELPTVEEKLILALRIIDTILDNILNGDNLLGAALYGELTRVANYNKVLKLSVGNIQDKKFMKEKFVPMLDGKELEWDADETKEALSNASSDVIFASRKWLQNNED